MSLNEEWRSERWLEAKELLLKDSFWGDTDEIIDRVGELLDERAAVRELLRRLVECIDKPVQDYHESKSALEDARAYLLGSQKTAEDPPKCPKCGSATMWLADPHPVGSWLCTACPLIGTPEAPATPFIPDEWPAEGWSGPEVCCSCETPSVMRHVETDYLVCVECDWCKHQESRGWACPHCGKRGTQVTVGMANCDSCQRNFPIGEYATPEDDSDAARLRRGSILFRSQVARAEAPPEHENVGRDGLLRELQRDAEFVTPVRPNAEQLDRTSDYLARRLGVTPEVEPNTAQLPCPECNRALSLATRPYRRYLCMFCEVEKSNGANPAIEAMGEIVSEECGPRWACRKCGYEVGCRNRPTTCAVCCGPGDWERTG